MHPFPGHSMLDPITAIDVASNVLQLLGAGTKLVAEVNAFVRSSGNALPSNAIILELLQESEDFAGQISTIGQATQELSKCESDVRGAADRFNVQAARFRLELESLIVKRSSSGFNTAMRALGKIAVTYTRQNKIRARLNNLQRLQDELANKLLLLIHQNQNSRFDKILGWMET